MVLETLVAAGSIWVGKRVFETLTKSTSPPGNFRSCRVAKRSSPRSLAESERVACRRLAVAVSGLSLAIGCSFGLMALAAMAAPVLLSGFVFQVRDEWRSQNRIKRVHHCGLIALVSAGAIARGYLVLIGIFEIAYFGSEVLLQKKHRKVRNKLHVAFMSWPVKATIPHRESDKQVRLTDLAIDDIVVVRSGEILPVDGTVVAGAGVIDQSTLTGDAVMAERTVSDQVFGSTLLLNGKLEILVERSGSETLACRVAAMLDAIEKSLETTVERRSAKFANSSIRPTIVASALGWITSGPITAHAIGASNFAETDRIVSLLSTYNYLFDLADAGIYLPDIRLLERLAKVDTIVFDKTHVLAADQLKVVQIRAAIRGDEHQVLAIAASAYTGQSDAVAAALRETAALLELQVARGVAERIESADGIAARVEGSRVLVGSRLFMQDESVTVPPGDYECDNLLTHGRFRIHVARDKQWVGEFTIQTSVRPEVVDVVSELRAAGYRSVLLSGEPTEPTSYLAKSLGVDDWKAGVMPHEQVAIVEKLQAAECSVCCVGDGTHSEMGMHGASVSVILRDNSIASNETAQITIRRESLPNLPLLFKLAKQFRSDQKSIRISSQTTSTLTTGASLLIGLPLSTVYLMHIGVLVMNAMASALPLLRNTETNESPLAVVPLQPAKLPAST